MTLPPVFLVDDAAPPPEGARLDGFAFEGRDLVVGSDGLAAFEASGGRLGWQADGVHVLTRRTDDRIEIGADYAGYRHLFHWSNGDRWAVSDSFVDLVAHLRSRGVTLTENRAQTGAFLSRGQLFQQLTGVETAVREIAVLRVDARIVVADGRLGIETAPAEPLNDYSDALHRFVDLWLSRILTLDTVPDLRVFFHLSGGMDSRCVAAFLVWLVRNGHAPERAGLRSLTDPAHESDLALARPVAAAAGLTLNGLAPRPRRALGVEEALTAWRRHSGGVYSPVRIPQAISDTRDVNLSGHATNGFKFRFTGRQARAAASRMHRAYGVFGGGDRARWRAAFDRELADMTARAGGNSGAAWARYQGTNRARFHAGQAATYKTQVALFHSRSAAEAAAARPQDAPDYQFYHDILAALAPDLDELPYDEGRKAPTDGTRARTTALLPLAPVAGRVWGAFPAPAAGPDTPPSQVALLRALLADIDAGPDSAWRGRINVLGRFHLWWLRRAIARGRVPHAVRLRHLHAQWLLVALARLGAESGKEETT